METSVNYRRGFQRLYILASIVWIVALLFVLPHDRLSFWSVAKKSPLVVDPSQVDDPWNGYDAKKDLGNDPVVPVPPPPPGSIPIGDQKVPDSTSRTQRTMWLASALFGPPALGYAAIFFVIPWVCRGFRPVLQIDTLQGEG